MKYYDEILSITDQIKFKHSFVPRLSYDNIVIAGMGGSSIAGEIFGEIYTRVPVVVSRGSDIPDFVSDKTLFIAISYSGNTEETISAVEQAMAKRAQIFIITSGGQLADIEEEKIIIPAGYQPRSAIGYLLTPLLRTFGLVDDSTVDSISNALNAVKEHEGVIKEIATKIVSERRIPFIIGVPPVPSVAYRWKTQFNENAKIFAHSVPYPEMNHNELEAIPNFFGGYNFEYFLSGIPRGQYSERIETTESIAGIRIHRLPFAAGDVIPELFASILYGDLLSYFIAVERGVEPRDVSTIQRFKESVRKH